MRTQLVLLLLVVVFEPQDAFRYTKCDIIKNPTVLIATMTSGVATIAKARVDAEIAKINAAINATPAPSTAAKACLELLKPELQKIATPSEAVKTLLKNCITTALAVKTDKDRQCYHSLKRVNECAQDAVEAAETEIVVFDLTTKIGSCKALTGTTSTLCADVANQASITAASLPKVTDGLKADIETAKGKVTTALGDVSLSQTAKNCLNALTPIIVVIGEPSAAVKSVHAECIKNIYTGLSAGLIPLCGPSNTATDQQRIDFNTQNVLPKITECETTAITFAKTELANFDTVAKITECKALLDSTLCVEYASTIPAVLASIAKVKAALKPDIERATAKVTTALEDNGLSAAAKICLRGFISIIIEPIGSPSIPQQAALRICIDTVYSSRSIDIHGLCNPAGSSTTQDKIAYNAKHILPNIIICENTVKTAALTELTNSNVDINIARCKALTDPFSTLCADALDQTDIVSASIINVEVAIAGDVFDEKNKVIVALEDNTISSVATTCLNNLTPLIEDIKSLSDDLKTKLKTCIDNVYSTKSTAIATLCASGSLSTVQDKIDFNGQNILPGIITCENNIESDVWNDISDLDITYEISECKLLKDSTLCADAGNPPAVITTSVATVTEGLATDTNAELTKVVTALADVTLTAPAKSCLNSLTAAIEAAGSPSSAQQIALKQCIETVYVDAATEIAKYCENCSTNEEKEQYNSEEILPKITICENTALTAAKGEIFDLNIDVNIDNCKQATTDISTLCAASADPTAVIAASLPKVVSALLKTDIATAKTNIQTALLDTTLSAKAITCLNELIPTIEEFGEPPTEHVDSHDYCIRFGYIELKSKIDALCASGTAEAKFVFNALQVLPMIDGCERTMSANVYSQFWGHNFAGKTADCKASTDGITLCDFKADSDPTVEASLIKIANAVKPDIVEATGKVTTALRVATLSYPAKQCLGRLTSTIATIGLPSSQVETTFKTCVEQAKTTLDTQITTLCADQTPAGTDLRNTFMTDNLNPMIKTCESTAVADVKTELTSLDVDAKTAACKLLTIDDFDLCDYYCDPTIVTPSSLTKVAAALTTDSAAASNKVTDALGDTTLTTAVKDCLGALLTSIAAIATPSNQVITLHGNCITQTDQVLTGQMFDLCNSNDADIEQRKNAFKTDTILPKIKSCETTAITNAQSELSNLNVETKIAFCRTVTSSSSTLCADAINQSNPIAASLTRVIAGYKADIAVAKTDINAVTTTTDAEKNCLASLLTIVDSLAVPSPMIRMVHVQCVMRVYSNENTNIKGLCGEGITTTDQQKNDFAATSIFPKIKLCEDTAVASAKTDLTNLNVGQQITSCSNF